MTTRAHAKRPPSPKKPGGEVPLKVNLPHNAPPAVRAAFETASHSPHSASLRHALADTLRATAYKAEAVACYLEAIALDPKRGLAYRDLGNVLTDLGRTDESTAALMSAMRLLPSEPSVLLGLIRAYRKLGTLDPARPLVERLESAALAQPRDARRQLYHGLALSQVDRLDDSITCVRRALALDELDVEAWDYLGMLLVARRDWDGARHAYDRALKCVPDRPQTLFNRATLRLRLGDYKGGFSDYKAGFDSPSFTMPRRDYGVPRWRGESLAGLTLLVHTEQGLGDTLQFVRYIIQLKAAGATRVVLECEDELVRLMCCVPGIDQVIRRGQSLPSIDRHAPLMSLASLFDATVDSVATSDCYLGIAQIRRALPTRTPSTRLRIGIVWEASRTRENFHAKSVSLNTFAPLAARNDIDLFSLQKGAGRSALAVSPLRSRVTDLGVSLVDFRDTAEVLAQLDLVITVDTPVCHLAGAMGIPVWTLLSEDADWRWLLDRSDSPWYPSMRLFRQATAGDWAPVFSQVFAAVDAATPHAFALSEKFASRAKVTADSHLLAALQHSAQGEFLEAACAYDEALSIDATDADIWNNFGVVLAKAQRLNESAQALQRALARQPLHADAGRNLAEVRAALGGTRHTGPQGNTGYLRVALDWQVGKTSGWGLYGFNLVAHTMRRGQFTPVLFQEPDLPAANSAELAVLEGLSKGRTEATKIVQQGYDCPFPSLHALGNGLIGGPLTRTLKSTRRIGIVFLEDPVINREVIARGSSYDRIVAGSTWNADLLKASGLERTSLVFQGIDTSVFHPAPRERRFADRFVVFSGGKLEYRKGQDLVIAAFSLFQRLHPEALLMVAWHNHWPETMSEIVTANHVRSAPHVTGNGRLEIVPWLVKHGIPQEAVIDLGLLPNSQMAPWVREADVAVFPNRAEGGTNIVAMEALACGVPCILSENTGHLDLTSDDHNIVLHHQGACRPTASFGCTDGWGESSVEEMLAALTFAYSRREESLRRAANAAEVMAHASWHFQIDRFFDAVGDVLS